MTKIAITLSIVLCLGACGATDYDVAAQTLQSCYDTGFGLKCVATPDGVEALNMDVDGDGTDDVFVCGDAASASDSDSAADDSDESVEDGEDTETGDADSVSDSDSASDSDEDCGPSTETDGESSESNSDEPDDGDGDTVGDSVDCDCI